MSEWISVDERLPDFKHCAGYVLVACDGGNVDVSFFSLNREYLSKLKDSGRYSRGRQGKNSGFFLISHETGHKVTHWMPLPQPPETDK